MKNKLYIIAITLLLGIGTYAQDDTLKYNILKDDPYELSKLQIGVSPLFMRFDRTNFTLLGIGADVTATISDKVDFHAIYNLGYYGFNSLLIVDGITDPYMYYDLDDIEYEAGPFNWMEIGFSIILSDQVRDQKHYMSVNSQQTGNVIINNLLTINSKYRKVRKLRGGFISTNGNESFMKSMSLNDELEIFTDDGTRFTTEGVTFSEIEYLDLYDHMYNGGIPSEYDWNDQEYSDIETSITLPYSTNIFYIGYGSEKIMNAIIDIDGHGKRYKRFRIESFIDLLYGKPEYGSFDFYKPNLTATHYYSEVLSETQEYNIDFEKSGYKLNNFGFRVGYIVRPVPISEVVNWEDKGTADSKLLYWSMKVSAGMLPSYQPLKAIFTDIGIICSFNPI